MQRAKNHATDETQPREAIIHNIFSNICQWFSDAAVALS